MAAFRARMDLLVGPPVGRPDRTKYVRADDVVNVGGEATPVAGGWLVGEGTDARVMPDRQWELLQPKRARGPEKE